MRIDRSKEWWLERARNEPDCPIGAGGVPQYSAKKALALGRIILRLRARLARLWRFGLIERTTAFRWEMDAALGEWSVRR